MTTQARDHKAILRGLATIETETVESLLKLQLENQAESGLDAHSYAIAKLSALVAMDAAPASYAWQIGYARANGVSDSELAGVLVALAPTVGFARIVSAATEMALVLDSDSAQAEAAGG
jgi:4-carboxymuconolactone decarboxylase